MRTSDDDDSRLKLKDIKKWAEWAMFHCGYPQTKVGTPFEKGTPYDFLSKLAKIYKFEQGTPYVFLSKICKIDIEKKHFSRAEKGSQGV